jgi:1-pyrroline-5-carboxylate dehydrogenase
MPKTSFVNESTYKGYVEGGNEEEFDRLFNESVKKTRSEFGSKYPIYIAGKPVYSNAFLEERSPIDSTLIGIFQKGTQDHAKQAIRAAHDAFKSWSSTDYKQRISIFRSAANILSKRKFDIAAILSFENGKTRYESIGEVDEAIDFMRYYSNDMELNKGYSRKTHSEKSTGNVSSGFQGAPGSAEKVNISMKPYGVFGVIAPFNFPISLSIGMSSAALITGNTVVFKPSSDNPTMLTGIKIYEIFKDAGLPDGVFNFLTGPGSVIGEELVNSENVAGIAFTGSRSTGIAMISKCFGTGHQKVFVMEMGGKNPTIISKNANIDDAVSGVASAAFGYAGQKCSALSRVYIHESIKEQFISKLVGKVREFKIGNPIEKDVYVGPLISQKAFVRYSDAIAKAKATARILYGGNPIKTGLAGSYYVEPTIIEAKHDSELVHSELFLPILTIESFKTIGEAIALANDTEYGLTAGFYSKSKKEIKEFSENIQAGVVYINRAISATTGAIVGLHTFVGWKGSALTGKGTGSNHYLSQYMREQSISVT